MFASILLDCLLKFLRHHEGSFQNLLQKSKFSIVIETKCKIELSPSEKINVTLLGLNGFWVGFHTNTHICGIKAFTGKKPAKGHKLFNSHASFSAAVCRV